MQVGLGGKIDELVATLDGGVRKARAVDEYNVADTSVVKLNAIKHVGVNDVLKEGHDEARIVFLKTLVLKYIHNLERTHGTTVDT